MTTAAEAKDELAAMEARALRALEISGRRLARVRGDRWGVLANADRRGRMMVCLPEASVERLAREGKLRALDATSYVLADTVAHERAPGPPLRWVFVAAAARRPGTRGRGIGFAGLAVLAQQGRGPLSMRQVQAGLRLVKDAERAAADSRVTMNWDAGPVTRQRRGGAAGGRRGDAKLAARFLARLRTRLGEEPWRLVWALCVDGESLMSVKKRLAIAQRDAHPFVARALEALAEAYDA
jgi:hypothetical protein